MKVGDGGSTPVEMESVEDDDRGENRSSIHKSRMGAGMLAQHESGLGKSFGCRPQSGGLSWGLLDLCFLLEHPYLAIGA